MTAVTIGSLQLPGFLTLPAPVLLIVGGGARRFWR
jgi:hypothetical protein